MMPEGFYTKQDKERHSLAMLAEPPRQKNTLNADTASRK